MRNFKGVITHQTVSMENFTKMMTMPTEEIKNWSTVGVKIVDKESFK